MQRVGEIHALVRPVERRNRRRTVLSLDAGKIEKGAELVEHIAAPKTVSGAQDPLGFEQHARRQESVLIVDQGPGLFGLAAVVVDQEPDNHIRVNRDHWTSAAIGHAPP